MENTTKYDDLINFFLDNWIIASIILIAVIIAFIPSFRDGFLQIMNLFRSIFKKQIKEFVIEYPEEKITFDIKIRSALFDIVKVNATTHSLGVRAEYQWIDKYYPDYVRLCQALSKIEVQKDHFLYFDTITIKNEKGKKKSIYFDISSFINNSGNTSYNINEFISNTIKELYK